VFVKSIGKRPGAEIEAIVLTDANGRYVAENLPGGRYRIDAEVPRGFRAASAQVKLDAGRRRIRNLRTAALPLPPPPASVGPGRPSHAKTPDRRADHR
jgi:hypothetical protein